MPVGPAIPGQPEQNVIPGVVTPTSHVPQPTAKEVLEPAAKSLPEIQAEDTLLPTGEEVHQKAREKSPDTAEGKARGVKADQPRPTGKDILQEVIDQKKDRLAQEDEQAKAVKDREQKVAEAVAKDREERQKAADEMSQKAKEQQDKAKEQVAQKATETAQAKPGEAQKDRQKAQDDAQQQAKGGQAKR